MNKELDDKTLQEMSVVLSFALSRLQQIITHDVAQGYSTTMRQIHLCDAREHLEDARAALLDAAQ